jgi:hypothetical protein
MDRLTQARAVFERRSAAYERMKDRLPSHQRAELLADLMEACDELDGVEGEYAALTEGAA